MMGKKEPTFYNTTSFKVQILRKQKENNNKRGNNICSFVQLIRKKETKKKKLTLFMKSRPLESV